MPATAPPRPPASTPDASDEWANRCERISSTFTDQKQAPLWLVVAGEIATKPIRLHGDQDTFNPNRTQYDGTAMLRAHLYRLVLPEINSYHRLATLLRARPPVAEWFGFDEIPSHDTLRLAWQERLDDETRAVIEFYGDRLRRDLLSLHHPEASRLALEGDEPYEASRDEQATEAQKEQALDWLRRHVFDDLADFGRADNAQYDDRLFLDIVGFLSATQEFAEKGVEMFGVQSGGDEELCHPETLRHAIRNLELDDVRERYDRAIDVMIDAAKERGMFDRPAMLAIDSTEIPFYGFQSDSEPPEEVIRVHRKPYEFKYEFMTISAEVEGRSVVLAYEPMVKGDDHAEAAISLIERAKELVPVEMVLWDRWYHNIKLMRYCDHNNVRYLGRAKRTTRVRDIIEDEFDPSEEVQKERYMMQDQSKKEYRTTLVAVPHDTYYNIHRGETSDDEP